MGPGRGGEPRAKKGGEIPGEDVERYLDQARKVLTGSRGYAVILKMTITACVAALEEEANISSNRGKESKAKKSRSNP
jgi:hypothetical protein